MGKTWILKDGRGKVVGYVLQREETVRCRLTFARKECEYTIFLLYSDRNTRCERIQQAGEELTIVQAGELIGAVVQEGEVVFASTGKEALCIYERTCQPKGQKNVETNASESRYELTDPPFPYSRILPVRRWPPPVCCPMAAYTDGQWMIGETIIIL